MMKLSVILLCAGLISPARLSGAQIDPSLGPPTELVATPGDHQVRLSWAPPASSDGSAVVDYLVQYRTAPYDYVVYNHPPAASSGITVSGLMNGWTYYFDVSAESERGFGASSQTVSALPGPLPASVPIDHIVSTGESLAFGAGGAPPLSLEQPFNNLMMRGDSFFPLGEISTETMSSGMANQAAFEVPDHLCQILVTLSTLPCADYSQMKKGTPPYNAVLRQVEAAKEQASVMGRPYRVRAVTTVHGEMDYIHGTAAAYEGDLADWQRDYSADIRAITGQTQEIPLFTDQMSSFTAATEYIPQLRHPTADIAVAQLAASEDHPGRIVLVGPKYPFDYVDGFHMNNVGYRKLGEYYGKVYMTVVVDGQPWVPLSPRRIVRQGRLITAQFNVPAPPVVFDTGRVLLKESYGFEYTDDSGHPPAIAGVAITAPDTVTITLASEPLGGHERLRYAYSGAAGSRPGAHEPGSGRGNLRDSDATPSLYGGDLYNWCVHFDKPVETAGAADLNGDGRIDIRDAILALRLAIGLSVLTPQQAAAAGLSPDGTIGLKEAVLLLRAVVR